MGKTTSTGIGAVLVPALLLLVAAGTAKAQDPGTAPWGNESERPPEATRAGLELDLSAAFLTPLSDLMQGTEATGALQLSTGVGLQTGGVWWLSRRLGVGLDGVWIPVDLDRQPSVADDGGQGVDPGGKVGEADYLAGTVELLVALPSVGTDVRVEPYLVAGAGLRHLSVEAGGDLPDEVTDPAGALGGGFRMLLSERLLMRLEARDRIAPADVGPETRVQHDLAVSVGLGVRP